ncbi:hypothetical protein NX059_009815 [Plenodomus lindquistii]|nr:hypothetical protein NX059_009815 [Plenodomus lindquistii]
MPADASNEARARTLSPTSDAPRGDSTGHKDSNVSPAPVVEAAATEGNGSPPLPNEEAPPLPDEPPPSEEDDGWEPKWDYNAGAYYFFNNKTGVSQWENPRVPTAPSLYGSYDRQLNSGAASLPTSSGAPGTSSPPRRRWGGYNPAIHGSYDPNADYAREATKEEEEAEQAAAAAAAVAAGLPVVSGQDYTATAQFNRFTGKFQQAGMGPEMHNDENKSKRQMTAFFDVDAAANSHDGRSLKAERRGKQLSKQELKAFKEKRRGKKEEKRRAWLMD